MNLTTLYIATYIKNLLYQNVSKLAVKKIIVLYIISFSFYVTNAQVGIGTITPDPSSAFEVSSTAGGMLTPRMTTAQRTAIINPATGLVLYDTDINSLYLYDGSSWKPIDAPFTRDNYKLIKNVSDLADELTVGGGTEYLLDENTLYEINGSITLAHPINLNNGYLFGKDSGEDILTISGNTMFEGTKGGTIRRLTLRAPGGSVFNLNASNTEDLVLKDAFIDGANSVGLISGFGLVFFRSVIFTNNDDGIEFSNIDDLFMDGQGWDNSNSGIYKTFTGTFNSIEKEGGFMEVTSATAGIDITGITSITGAAQIKGVNFFGGGNYINGVSPYSGYNFNSDWDVDCPGIPLETDNVASANFYYTGDLNIGFTQTISSSSPVEIQGEGTFASNNLFRFRNESGQGNNRMVYEGNKKRSFQANASLSVRVQSAGGNFYAFAFAKNGTLITESNSVVYIASDSQIQNVSLNCVIEMNTNDYIEVYVERITGFGNDTLAVFSQNVTIK
ncbi:MAG: cell wall anchor protein [Patiriisocius sp.]|uniref:cell wall anchor protein n=1 Tax=Patiriisocius sp. TaxID=2822396 RepID=UPI003EF28AC0